MHEGIGDRFQQETKYHRGRMLGGALDWSSQPPLYKTYPGANKIPLPPPAQPPDMTLDRTLRMRKSVRRFTLEPLNLGVLSYLLWAASGIQRVEGGYEFRTAPSAGALYPIETYVVAHNVQELAKGIYHYAVRSHALEELALGDFRQDIARAALDQRMCAEAPMVLVWTAIFERSRWKYKQRAYRYIYLDAGHIVENLALAATALGLGSCQIGALFDDEVNRVVGVDGIEESVVYMSVVGYPLR